MYVPVDCELTEICVELPGGTKAFWEKENKSSDFSTIDVSQAWSDTHGFFVFFAQDCFQPSLHLIRAPSWEKAYEVFIEQEADRGHYLINDDDPDYSEDSGHYTNDGRRVDTENFMGYEVKVISYTVVDEPQEEG